MGKPFKDDDYDKAEFTDDDKKCWNKTDYTGQHICDCGGKEFKVFFGYYATATVCLKCHKMESVHDG